MTTVTKSSDLLADEKYKAGTLGSSMTKAGLLGGILLLGLSVGLGFAKNDHLHHFFSAYLTAWSFILTICIGGLFYVLIQHLTRSRMSALTRRLAEHLTMAFPLVGLLGLGFIVPLVAGNDQIYYWTTAESQLNHHIHGKHAWLNPGFFAIRYVVYFAIWIGLSTWFRKQSMAQDETGDPELSTKMRVASAPAIIVFALTVVFSSFDLLMSTAPKWYSTIYGVNVFGGAVLAIYSTLALLTMAIQRSGRLTRVINENHYHDLGKMMFAFTFFWAYTAFSQFMLIWYANIPEETVFYKYRMFTDWQYVSIALLVGHWALPFLLLLTRWTKRILPLLAVLAVWQLVFHYIDLYWNVMPHATWAPNAGPLSGELSLYKIGFDAMDVTLLLSMVLFFIAGVGRGLKGNLVPVKDPNLKASIAFDNY